MHPLFYMRMAILKLFTVTFDFLKTTFNCVRVLWVKSADKVQPTTIFDGRVKVNRDGSLEVDYSNHHVREAIKKHVDALSNSVPKEN